MSVHVLRQVTYNNKDHLDMYIVSVYVHEQQQQQQTTHLMLNKNPKRKNTKSKKFEKHHSKLLLIKAEGTMIVCCPAQVDFS